MNFDEERALAIVAHEAIVETRRRRRWQIFFRFFWMGYFLLMLLILLSLGGGDRDNAASGPGVRHIAVVPIQGLIAADSDANADDTIRSLEKAFKNPNAKAGLEHADPRDLIAAMRSHEIEALVGVEGHE